MLEAKALRMVVHPTGPSPTVTRQAPPLQEEEEEDQEEQVVDLVRLHQGVWVQEEAAAALHRFQDNNKHPINIHHQRMS